MEAGCGMVHFTLSPTPGYRVEGLSSEAGQSPSLGAKQETSVLSVITLGSGDSGLEEYSACLV